MLFGSLFAGVEEGTFAGLVVAAGGTSPPPSADFRTAADSELIPVLFGDETS